LSGIVLLSFCGCEASTTTPPIAATNVDPNVSVSTDDRPIEPSSQVRSVLLKLDIEGFANDVGRCRVAVYLGKEHFNDLDYAVAKEPIPIENAKAAWEVLVPFAVVDDRSKSQIAVSVYHDENDNLKLDKSSFGVPLERYGFSKNPKRGFGPPKFGEVAVDVDLGSGVREPHLNLQIQVK
jgi:uncharacterized protein (DUF2141 family)